MLRQFNRFLVLGLIVALALVFTLTNSDPATIKLGPNFQLTAYAGVIYMAVFAAGCVAASLVAFIFGFKSYLRERKLLSAERSRQAFFELFVKARGLMAAHEWNRARDVWEQVLRREPENVVARVELSRCLDNVGDSREALRVLDATRASSRASSEVLFRAAELNVALGNSTGAGDNLAILVSEAPTKRALELARDISERMGRFEDALEYQDELDKLGYDPETTAAVRSRLGFAQLTRDATDTAALHDALQGFVRRHSHFVPALEKLAELEIARGKNDDGAELLFRAAKSSKGKLEKWENLIHFWLTGSAGDVQRRVDRAVAAARAAAQETSGSDRVRAELVLAQTLLAVNKAEDARRVLDGLSALADKEGVMLTSELMRLHLILRGLCLARLGLAKDTAPIWQQLGEPVSSLSRSGQAFTPQRDATEPSPALSTP